MNEYEYITNSFTKEGENTNLEVNNLNVSCITSKNNKFELDSNGNLTVQSLTVQNNNGNNVDSGVMLNFVYPVGSIYMSVNETNPSMLFGGTWEQLRDRFLLGCGDTYQNGAMGGEATHPLTISEMPSHNHTATTNTTGAHRHGYNGWWSYAAGNAKGSIANERLSDSERFDPFNSAGAHSHTVTINNTGDGQAHNNMPPYLAVYMWKRVS